MTTALQGRLQQALGDVYTIERELTPGGMSRLFLATERALEREVVVKLLPPELANDVGAERFRREMLVTARLQHPHILPVLHAGARDGLLFYVMPYVRGESLRARLERERPLPIADVVRILRQLADALACAHDAGVVHRDVKPENVLFQHDHAVLADFGIARALAQSGGGGGDRLTATGLGIGTLGYMAPEQIAGEREVDARADLYALGVMGYEMLAGTQPFVGTTPMRVLAAQLTEPPRPLGELRTDVPPALSTLVARLLQREPSARPQSAREVRRALEETTATAAPKPAVPDATRDAGRDPIEWMLARLLPNGKAPPETVDMARSLFVARSFRKGQAYQRPGEVTSHGAFVVRGLFRWFSVDANGNESILRFSEEGAWIGDLQSFSSGNPTPYYIIALEPSEVLMIDGHSFERMLERAPDQGRGFRMGLQQSRDVMERRIALYLHASAEERYADYAERYPWMVDRVPQHMLASYLGMTPETLSRIRRKRKAR